MKSFQLRLSSLALMASGFVSPSIAFAQPEECAEDADCEHGYTCEVTAVSGCAQPACEPDSDCQPVDCASVEYRSCVPATDCDDDADCADGMVCHSYEQSSCTDVACSSEADCADQKPVCETETVSACTPRSQLPCAEASECGEGFDCVMIEECSCSGGGSDPAEPEPAPAPADEGGEGVAPPEDGADGDQSSGDQAEEDVAERPLPPEEANCVCEPSDVGYCQAKLIECDTDAECPADWTCQHGATAEPPSAGVDLPTPDEPAAEGEALAPPQEPPAGSAVDGGAAEPSDDVPVDDDTKPAEDPAPEQGYCIPPFSGGSIPPGAEEPGRPTTGEATGGGDNAGEGPTDANGEPSGSTDDEVDVDEGKDGSDDNDPVPAEPEDTDNPAGVDAGHDDLTEDESDMGADEAAKDDGGCSVAAAPKSGSSKAPWLLALLGLALLRRRR